MVSVSKGGLRWEAGLLGPSLITSSRSIIQVESVSTAAKHKSYP